MSETEVWAAGGVVIDDRGRMLVVHRPRYDDWTFPKGKLDPGETLEECALREVLEESGCECVLGDAIGAIRYTDHKGRSKEVRYWFMEPVTIDFEPNDEVDEVAWLAPDQVVSVLTYQRDLDILAAATDTLG